MFITGGSFRRRIAKQITQFDRIQCFRSIGDNLMFHARQFWKSVYKCCQECADNLQFEFAGCAISYTL